MFPEIDWVNGFRLADPGLAVERPPVLLAPMAVLLRDRIGRMAISAQMMRGILDSIAARLDEARDMLRYMDPRLPRAARHVLGLIETIGSVGNVINTSSRAAAAAIFDSSRRASPPRSAAWEISFSSSLFGLAGSLCLGFLDLQTSQAQNRFYTELEDWLSTTVRDLVVERDPTAALPMAAGAPTGDLRVAIERLREAITDGGSNRAATSAMANLAEAIQGLVHHMRTEQQMIRDWVDSGPAASRGSPPAGDSRARRREEIAPGRIPWLSHARAATAA